MFQVCLRLTDTFNVIISNSTMVHIFKCPKIYRFHHSCFHMCLLILWVTLLHACCVLGILLDAGAGKTNKKEIRKYNSFLQGGHSIKELKKNIHLTRQLQCNTLCYHLLSPYAESSIVLGICYMLLLILQNLGTPICMWQMGKLGLQVYI